MASKFDFKSLAYQKNASVDESKAAFSAAESSFYVRFAGLVTLFGKMINYNQVHSSGFAIPPVVAKILLPLGVFGAMKDVYNTKKMYTEAGFDDFTVTSLTASRATYQVINNFVIPASVFSFITKQLSGTTQFARGGTAGLMISALAALALSNTVEEVCDSGFLNARLTTKAYFAQAPDSMDRFRQFVRRVRPTTTPAYDNNEYQSLFPGFMLAEAAPSFEADPALGKIGMYGRHYADKALLTGDYSNVQGTIIGVPVPTANSERPFTAFGDYNVDNGLKEMDTALGLVLPTDLSAASLKKMIDQVDQVYTTLNK